MTRTLIVMLIFFGVSQARAQEITLYGAGSLRDAITSIVTEYTNKTGAKVKTAFGPSGLMRDKIEAGDKVDLFASADMGHALKLRKDGRAASVAMFTRNKLCAFAKPDAGLSAANFADRLLDPSIKLGTSTPNADPGGDYTWEMFHLIDKAHPGAFATLDTKAQKVMGGPTTAADAAIRNPVAVAFAKDQINVVIGYCSGADEQRKDTPGIEIVQVPNDYATGPEYGLAIMSFDKPMAVGLAFAILSPEGQATLGRFGFAPVGMQAGP